MWRWVERERWWPPCRTVRAARPDRDSMIDDNLPYSVCCGFDFISPCLCVCVYGYVLCTISRLKRRNMSVCLCLHVCSTVTVPVHVCTTVWIMNWLLKSGFSFRLAGNLVISHDFKAPLPLLATPLPLPLPLPWPRAMGHMSHEIMRSWVMRNHGAWL